MDFPKSVPGVGLVGGEFVNEDPLLGQQGSLIPAEWGNAVAREILSVVEAAGLTPDEQQHDQLVQAIQKLQADLSADSGMVVFSTAGVHTFSVPDVLKSGKKTAKVTVSGGGGSGAAGATTASGGGAGGVWIGCVSLSGLSSVVVTVGAGGASVAPTANGLPGGTSSFGTFCSAGGGSGGMTSGSRVSGGNASGGGGVAYHGGQGGVGITDAGTVKIGGAGGASVFGAGGQPGSTGMGDGLGYGGGGAGAIGAAVFSGAGSPGIVIVEW